MANSDPKDDNVINLAQIQDIEAKTANDDSILSEEEELLGLNKPTSTGQTATTTKIGVTSKFHIPQVVKEKYPELIPLIIQTESMDDEEREYWFQILPIMTEDQVHKLREILVGEKKQLAKLDAEYEEELAKINDKHIQEWESFESQQQKVQLAQAEQAQEAAETDAEEDILNKLNNL